MKIVYSDGHIAVEELLRFFSLGDQLPEVCRQLIIRKEMAKQAPALNIEVSEEQVQTIANAYRKSHGLYLRDDTLRFLASKGVTEEDFGTFCEQMALEPIFKDRMVDEKKIKDYFINNHASFERAKISKLTVPEETLAQEILLQIREEGADFQALTQQYSIDEAEKSGAGAGFIVSRSTLPTDMAAKIFNAAPGEVLGPFKRDHVYLIIRVEEVTKAELNAETKEAIMQSIFAEWVSQFFKEDVKVAP
jgi:peptidylprolyl isomerase